MNAIDTNIYVYTLDADEPVKQSKAMALLGQLALSPSETVILWQVAGEFLCQLRRFEAKGLLTAGPGLRAGNVELAVNAQHHCCPRSALNGFWFPLGQALIVLHIFGSRACNFCRRSKSRR